MILFQRTENMFGTIDGRQIVPDSISKMPIDQIRQIPLPTDSGMVALEKIFHVSCDTTSNDTFLIIEGDCQSIDGIGTNMQSGNLCILGDVGERTATNLKGGTIVISGNASDQLGAGMSDGLIYVAGNCGHGLAAPLPGKKSGMRGGDILVTGNVGDRACERMRRGTVFVAGDAGDFCAPQMIAGSLVVMGKLGQEWGGGMRRGSLILGKDIASSPAASLSDAREFELSFLPLIWKHIDQMQQSATAILHLAIGFSSAATLRRSRIAPKPIRVPATRWVQRQIADLNCKGRGEVLVLKRISSLAFEAWR